MGINCLWISAPQPAENVFQAHFHRFFQQKHVKTDQVCYSSFDPEFEIPAQEEYAFVFAGRFSVVSESCSWSVHHMHARGFVRPFFVLGCHVADVASSIYVTQTKTRQEHQKQISIDKQVFSYQAESTIEPDKSFSISINNQTIKETPRWHHTNS